MVLGAGAVGTAIASTLQGAGFDTLLVGQRPRFNASSVAAGMISPLLEHRIDPASAACLDLLASGADLWPAFARATGIALRTSGALWLSPAAGDAGSGAGLRTLRPVSPGEAQVLQPRLGPWDGPIVFAPDEACVDPRQGLTAMEAAFVAAGGRFLGGMARQDGEGWAVGADRVLAGAVVIATGYEGQGLSGSAPELARLRPIRGQIARVAAGLDPRSACIRGPGAYVAPQADGSAMVGATMEFGEAEPAASPADAGALVAAATRFMPHLAACSFEALAGIRATTPDNLPMVGRSGRANILLATGMRRNGWLLTPLVAQMIRDYLAGNDPGAFAGALDPGRFDRAGCA